MAGADTRQVDASSSYLRLLLALLVSAAFFDGYDNQVLSLLLPNIQRSYHLATSTLGLLHGPVVAGQLLALPAMRLADRVGRRPLLLVSVVGYTVFTGLTALAWNVWAFVVLQFLAQAFIGAEFAAATTIVVEEFPAAQCGRALGALLAFGPLGAVAVAIGVVAHLQDLGPGWRSFYLIGLVPLVVVGLARRRLQETRRWQADLPGRTPAMVHPSILAPWNPPYRRRLLGVGFLSGLQATASTAAVGWFAYYAEHQRHHSSTVVGALVGGSALVGLAGYYCCGRAMDRFGRRPVATVYLLAGVIFAVSVFQVGALWLWVVLLPGAVFFGLGVGPVLSAYASELFPTYLRAQASAWIRNTFAVGGSFLGPALVGLLGGSKGSLLPDLGDAVSLLSLVALPGIWLVWKVLPETRGLPLEELAPS